MARASIKSWPEDERPRERLVRYGSNTLSDVQLLAILLVSGDCSNGGGSAIDLARNIIATFGSFTTLEQISISELCKIKGIGHAKAAKIKAALEIGKRMEAGVYRFKRKITSSKEVVSYYLSIMRNIRKEIFRTVLLDTKNNIIKDVIISEGSLNNSIVHPREVMNPAIRESAASIILIHNHPSGDPTPSRDDIEITQRLRTAGDILGINVLDHIIIGEKRYFSFTDEGIKEININICTKNL